MKARRTVNAVIDSIIKPSTCFANISENARYYFTSSVIIFAIAAVSSFLSSFLNVWYWNPNAENYLDFRLIPFLMSTSHTLLQNIVLVAAIFWIGKQWGGTTSFKKIFSVISHCLVPATAGAVLIPVAMALISQSLSAGTGVGGSSMDLDLELSPRYALDYASSAIISFGLLIPFAAWIFTLFVKATRIVNNFDLKKSIITVVFGIGVMYLSQMVFGISSHLLFNL